MSDGAAVLPEIPSHQCMPTPVDLCFNAIDEATKMLSGTPVYLVASEALRDVATAASKEYGLPVVLLPPDMLREKTWPWAVVAASGSVFSAPWW